ncbi:MAG TPA: glycosyltransferase [bacterium]|nr:glycosyltransferase [bacterium]HPP12061.1 glycosyltransferase [bacterium]
MRTRVYYIIGTLEIGGAEKQLLKLCQGLDKKKFLPGVIVLRSGGALKKDFLKSGVEVLEAGKRFKVDVFFFLRLVRILKKEKPDIVHTFMFTANTWGRLAALLAGVPIIFSSERCVDIWKRWYHRLIDRFLLRFTRQVVANSLAVRDFYQRRERIPQEKITVIPNGIEVEKFADISLSSDKKKALGLEEASFVIGAGGRFTPQKGLIFLIRAMPEVLKVFPDAVAVLVGDGPLRKELETAARQAGVSRNMVFTGYRDDIHEIFSGVDVVVVPSLFEGMPNVVLEAMALRKPVIGSDIPEIAELVEDGKNGFLVPVRDPEALAKKIIMLLKDGKLRRSMGEYGYWLVKERFSVIGMVQAYESLYQNTPPARESFSPHKGNDKVPLRQKSKVDIKFYRVKM